MFEYELAVHQIQCLRGDSSDLAVAYDDARFCKIKKLQGVRQTIADDGVVDTSVRIRFVERCDLGRFPTDVDLSQFSDGRTAQRITDEFTATRKDCVTNRFCIKATMVGSPPETILWVSLEVLVV